MIELITSFYNNEGFERTSSLAYSFLVSFVPLFITIASITTFFISNSTYLQMESYIVSNYLPVIGNKIAPYMEKFRNYSGQLTIYSLIFLFITSISLINTLRHHIEKLWNVEALFKINSHLFINFSLTIIGPILIAASLIATSYIDSIIKHKYIGVLNIFEFLTTFIGFMCIYKFVPRTVVPTKYSAIAAAVATIFFELAKVGFIIHIRYFSTESLLYGSLATIPLFIIWLYICSLIILISAQIIYTLKKLSNQ